MGRKAAPQCYWNIGSMSRQLAPEPRYFSALNGRRCRGAHKARLELLAMGSVVDPLARRGDPLAGNHRGVADDSGQVAMARALMHSRHRGTARQGQPELAARPSRDAAL